ncbi:LTA synthase family protein [Pseudomonas palleroniana]|uniref:LTA synthase family protein n=1 Tax=Pseudomonas palleroniana TaxID=191390 RepID=UPI001FCBE6CE|nr:LTA synthase family protein [Pseudomonas palleroniana]UOK40451.1 LTA synthase family protein [Pseudomonas palleroniana]
MANPDALNQQRASNRLLQPTVKSHLAYTLLCALVMMVMFSLLRLALLVYNREMILDTPASTFLEAFANGTRFDIRFVMYALVPLLLALFSVRAMAARGFFRLWLTVASSIALFLGLMEMDFYREFHQRLNGLVFQYVKEDPKTVMSMLWYGFPVVRYLLAWAVGTLILSMAFKGADRATRPRGPFSGGSIGTRQVAPWYARIAVFVVCLLIATVAIRGTLRQGPPLRWGDVYTTDSNFANQLGLNGTLSLIAAAKARFSEERTNIWKATLDQPLATRTVRDMLLLPAHEKLVDTASAAVRRDFTPPAEKTLPIKNVVVILMESFAGHSVGALGRPGNITPYFDKLSKEGLLFDRFFSNGTHTHQGMFATMACFPNLPGFEYLMQTPEGSHKLSGLPQLLSARKFDDVYVYNGDFAWDNQSGFFSNQGMTNFIGRNDFVNPVFSDPTWGVSDQDMFNRGLEELKAREGGKPFYALLQTLSNHTPYALPTPLPVEKVTDRGSLNEHLTAMRYSDWALGQFFEKARKEPYFKETLFVVVGDHGFGNEQQITEMDLGRFNVPMLMIAPGMQEKFGVRDHTVGTQIDIVPTIMGRLGGDTLHQCWGRDLLNLPEGDKGFGVIKPSGSDQTVALLTDDRVLVLPKDMPPKLWEYGLGENPTGKVIPDSPDEAALKQKLESFLQTATKSLLDNTAGVVDGKPD